MSRLTEEKEEQAIRILEAMSGVEEELLARSEQKAPAKQTGKVVRFWHKYGKAMAACACLAVLGTAFWGIGNLSKSSDNAAAEPQGMAFVAQDTAPKAETSGPESIQESAAADVVEEVDEATWSTAEDSEPAGVTTEEDQGPGKTSGATKEAFEDKRNYLNYGAVKALDRAAWSDAAGISLELPADAQDAEYSVLDGDIIVYQVIYLLGEDAYTMRMTKDPVDSDISGMVYDWNDYCEFIDEYGTYYFALTDVGQGVCFWKQGEYTCTVAMNEHATMQALTEARQHFAKQLAE